MGKLTPNRCLLRIQTQAANALLVCAYSVIGYKLSHVTLSLMSVLRNVTKMI